MRDRPQLRCVGSPAQHIGRELTAEDGVSQPPRKGTRSHSPLRQLLGARTTGRRPISPISLPQLGGDGIHGTSDCTCGNVSNMVSSERATPHPTGGGISDDGNQSIQEQRVRMKLVSRPVLYDASLVLNEYDVDNLSQSESPQPSDDFGVDLGPGIESVINAQGESAISRAVRDEEQP